MSKPVMFHFVGKFIYIFLYAKLFPKLFAIKSEYFFVMKLKIFVFML